MQENNDDDRVESDEGRKGLLDRARGMASSARQNVSRPVDVLTGADIRRFDEFTDATTRAVVGVHQDLSVLQGKVVRMHRTVDDMRERQKRLAERIDQLERSISRRTSLTPWILGAALAALVSSVVAVLVSVS